MDVNASSPRLIRTRTNYSLAHKLAHTSVSKVSNHTAKPASPRVSRIHSQPSSSQQRAIAAYLDNDSFQKRDDFQAVVGIDVYI